jgi:hypothetical protein
MNLVLLESDLNDHLPRGTGEPPVLAGDVGLPLASSLALVGSL